jgi:hypothetical protein
VKTKKELLSDPVVNVEKGKSGAANCGKGCHQLMN